MRRYLCGVPKDSCCGTDTMVNAGLGGRQKLHGSPQEAFDCHARWLKSRGYMQVGGREFVSPPDADGNQYTTVLTKKSRFGTRLRRGKVGEGPSGAASRFEATRGKQSCTGVIISQ